MGGERFESPQPGEYLFGDSDELNFLGNKPVPVRTKYRKRKPITLRQPSGLAN